MDQIHLDCVENIKDKPTGNDFGFITHSNKINGSGKWLDSSGYLITWRQNLWKKRLLHGPTMEDPKKKSRLEILQ